MTSTSCCPSFFCRSVSPLLQCGARGLHHATRHSALIGAFSGFVVTKLGLQVLTHMYDHVGQCAKLETPLPELRPIQVIDPNKKA